MTSDGGRRGQRPGSGSRAPLAVALWVLAALLTGAGIVFALVNPRPPAVQSSGSPTLDAVLGLVGLVFPSVGLVIVLRQPGHAVGWLFLAAGVGAALEDAAAGWATYGLETRPGSLPAPALAGLVADLVWIPILATGITLLFLVFPEGHLPRDRWRWLTRLAFADLAVYVVATTVNPGPLYYLPDVPNPLGIRPWPVPPRSRSTPPASSCRCWSSRPESRWCGASDLPAGCAASR